MMASGGLRRADAMAPPSSRYACQSCGHAALAWSGRCAGCGEWNRLVETRAEPAAAGTRRRPAPPPGAVPLREGRAPAVPRLATGIAELDRVLGGGLVPGSLV